MVLRQAVDRLGDDEFGTSAQYLFGLVRGTFGRRPTDLRERAGSYWTAAIDLYDQVRAPDAEDVRARLPG